MDFEYVGIAVQQDSMHIWGSSPICGPDGKIHLFVAQWSMKTQSDFSGWYKDCEIAHYVGNSPEGPFKFVRIAVADQDGKFNSPHNPTIKYIDGRYVLCFIVNENNDLKTQRIVMYVADNLDDNWRPASGAEADGTILRKSTDPSYWNYTAKLGVSNPTLIKHKGKYLLYDKSVVKKEPKGYAYVYGVSVSDRLEGPYIHHPERVTAPRMQLEDAYAFSMNDSVYLVTRDFHASLGSNGGGLLWKSDDGFFFNEKETQRSYEDLAHYLGKETLSNAKLYRGKIHGNLERPQILFVDGKPAYIYLATGINANEGFGSCSHVFCIKNNY
ncbi:glycoside hydrolase family protein [Labilibaculum sp.]|uniref:glycoside hydrolase family protein n=1 Tax=Labilibaculum sp. TaxID=2060723 RepID=UPI003569E36B